MQPQGCGWCAFVVPRGLLVASSPSLPIGQNVRFHSLKRGVSHTCPIGVTQTCTIGVSHTPFEVVE